LIFYRDGVYYAARSFDFSTQATPPGYCEYPDGNFLLLHKSDRNS